MPHGVSNVLDGNVYVLCTHSLYRPAEVRVPGLEDTHILLHYNYTTFSGIPAQVPAIETCFMSVDEIARIFSKSLGLYRGGDFGILLGPIEAHRGARPGL